MYSELEELFRESFTNNKDTALEVEGGSISVKKIVSLVREISRDFEMTYGGESFSPEDEKTTRKNVESVLSEQGFIRDFSKRNPYYFITGKVSGGFVAPTREMVANKDLAQHILDVKPSPLSRTFKVMNLNEFSAKMSVLVGEVMDNRTVSMICSSHGMRVASVSFESEKGIVQIKVNGEVLNRKVTEALYSRPSGYFLQYIPLSEIEIMEAEIEKELGSAKAKWAKAEGETLNESKLRQVNTVYEYIHLTRGIDKKKDRVSLGGYKHNVEAFAPYTRYICSLACGIALRFTRDAIEEMGANTGGALTGFVYSNSRRVSRL